MLNEQVLITTDHTKRGVFYGTLAQDDGSTVVLKDARNIVYWSKETRGVFGLASGGPADGSRVGPVVPEIKLTGVTAIVRCAPEAVERFKADVWG